MDPMGFEDIPDFLNTAGVYIWDGMYDVLGGSSYECTW